MSHPATMMPDAMVIVSDDIVRQCHTAWRAAFVPPFRALTVGQ